MYEHVSAGAAGAGAGAASYLEPSPSYLVPGVSGAGAGAYLIPGAPVSDGAASSAASHMYETTPGEGVYNVYEQTPGEAGEGPAYGQLIMPGGGPSNAYEMASELESSGPQVYAVPHVGEDGWAVPIAYSTTGSAPADYSQPLHYAPSNPYA